MAIAGEPWSWAWWTRSSSLHAPSSSEYCVWRWRWTNCLSVIVPSTLQDLLGWAALHPGASRRAGEPERGERRSRSSCYLPHETGLSGRRCIPELAYFAESFPLDGARRLGGDVVYNPIHAADLVDDAGRHAGQKVRLEAVPVRRH